MNDTLKKTITLKLRIRSVFFAIGLVGSLIPFSLLGLLLFPFSMQHRYNIISQWSVFVLWWLKLTCKLDYEITGLENIPKGACIVLSKHQSSWETLVLQPHINPQTWVLKRELLWIPFIGWGLAMLKPIAINRSATKSAARQVLELGKIRLREGISLVVYPEGTRIPPGRKGVYKIGGALLAKSSRSPILPIAHNAGEFWPRGSFIKYPGTVKMVIGPIIETKGQSADALNQEAEAWIEGQMKEISGVPYTGEIFERKKKVKAA